jgi:hypothetical protein
MVDGYRYRDGCRYRYHIEVDIKTCYKLSKSFIKSPLQPIKNPDFIKL